MAQNQVLTGQQAVAADNAPVQMRGDRYGATVVTELQPRYYEHTKRGHKFSAANQAGQVTTVGLATTYTGMGIYNPVGSGVELVLEKVGYAVLVAPAAAMVIGLMVGFPGANPTGVTTLTPKNDYLGQLTPLGIPFSVATIGTPTLSRVLDVAQTGAITTSPKGCSGVYDIEGGIIIPPGGFAAFYTSTASGAAGFMGSMAWFENLI